MGSNGTNTHMPFSTDSIKHLDGEELTTSSRRAHRFTDEENARMTVTGSQTAKWWDTAFHNVTAMVGAGVLGLPYAMTYLGWAGGVITLLYSWGVSLFTFQFLVYLHEMPDGTRFNRYHELTREVLGDFWGTWLLLPFQITVFVGVPITFSVIGGQSLHKVFFERALRLRKHKNVRLSDWIIIISDCAALL
eukprot:jgi/Botrbrau1/20991/Bobra.0144s0010.1